MKKIRVIAIAAAFLGFIAGFAILSGAAGRSSTEEVKSSGNAKATDAVVAVADIPPYTTITAEMVQLKQVALLEGDQNHYENVDEVIGKVSVADVFANEIVTQSRVVDPGETNVGLALKIAEGKRAITFQVDVEQRVANTIKVGNYVDVIYTVESQSKEENQATMTVGLVLNSIFGDTNPANSYVMHDNLGDYFSTMVLQDIKVLAIADKFFVSQDDVVTGNTYETITLEVTPEQATQLTLMDTNGGSLRFVLRGQNDDGIIDNERGDVYQEVGQIRAAAEAAATEAQIGGTTGNTQQGQTTQQQGQTNTNQTTTPTTPTTPATPATPAAPGR